MLTDELKDIKTVARGAGTTFIGSGTGRGLFFISQVIVARFLGAEVFGLYILGLVVLRIADLLARFGLHTGAMKFVSIHKDRNPGIVKGTLISTPLIAFINGVLIGILLYLLSGFISTSLFHKPELQVVITLFALSIPFVASTMVVADAIQGFHTTRYSVLSRDIVQQTTNILFVIFFMLVGAGIKGVVYAFTLSYIFALITALCFANMQFPALTDRSLMPVYQLKETLLISLPMVFTGFFYLLLSWTDIFMLGYYGTSSEVGIYRAASQIPLVLTMALNASNSIYAPLVADVFYSREMKRFENIFKTTTRWIFYFALPVSLILISSASELMLIFGKGFVETGAIVLIILTIAQFVNCATGGVGLTLAMTGRHNMAFWNSFLLVISNIILNLLLIPRYGATGAALATGISIIAINLIALLEVYLLYKIHPYNKGYLYGIISSAVATILLIFINKELTNLSAISAVLLNSLIVGGVFIGFIAIAGVSNEDRYIIDSVKARLTNMVTRAR